MREQLKGVDLATSTYERHSAPCFSDFKSRERIVVHRLDLRFTLSASRRRKPERESSNLHRDDPMLKQIRILEVRWIVYPSQMPTPRHWVLGVLDRNIKFGDQLRTALVNRVLHRRQVVPRL